ncbi:hypothetical protein Pla123a_46720 [Posidoniimonas polymericola]|uniref:Uncharacterized protein n=1 Tax=Posidoniimonas polymericola TaxID=2528002 RepID=A0A5C5XU79_9BACT|nr:hypothetical protein [Posidoniimonas polymericola]TWT66278.1 hypothetical protein Pla123a_46720 [Posidoniimonas polymericola]
MNSREWFCLALRVMGVWQLSSVVPYLAMLVASLASGGNTPFEFFIVLLWVVVYTGLGLFLLLFAPAIAARFYPGSAAESRPTAQDLPDRMLELGLRLLGAYLLVLAVHTLLTYVANAIAVAAYSNVSWRQQLAASGPRELISTAVYVTLGLVVLAGPKRIIAGLDRLRYNAERDAYTPPPIAGAAADEDQA